MSCCDEQIQAIQPVKRADPFSLILNFKGDGVYSVEKSQLRKRSGALVADLVVTEISANQFSLTYADTNEWPIANLICDIQYTHNGATRTTSTFMVPVIERVTK